MGKTLEEVAEIKKGLVKKLMFSQPYNNYVNKIGIANLAIMTDEGEKIELKEGETPEDFCISVGFRVHPPKDLNFPSEENGVRIFYEFIGEITAY